MFPTSACESSVDKFNWKCGNECWPLRNTLFCETNLILYTSAAGWRCGICVHRTDHQVASGPYLTCDVNYYRPLYIITLTSRLYVASSQCHISDLNKTITRIHWHNSSQWDRIEVRMVAQK